MASTQTQLPAGLAKLMALDKKALTLGVLILVLAALWGKMALSGRTPKSASGMTIAPIAAPAASDSNNKPALPDSTNLLRDWINEPLPETVSRNIFEVKLDYYPMDASHITEPTRTVDDPTFWDKLAKSIDAQADQQHKKENLIQNLRQQASQLQLTSTVMGSRPRAMLNASMVGVEEVVAGFRVLEIRARSVVVEREGIKLEIPMK